MSMVNIIENVKSKLLTVIVILVTLVIIYNFYKNQNEQIDSLKEMQSIEIKKLTVLKNIQATQQELEAYKRLLTKVLEDSIISSLSDFAKSVDVQVESFKPESKKVNNDYVEFPFILTVKAKSYHNLAKFVSKIENYAQVFVITNADIDSVDNRKTDITARISLSNIVFLENENNNENKQ